MPPLPTTRLSNNTFFYSYVNTQHTRLFAFTYYIQSEKYQVEAAAKVVGKLLIWLQ